jgi:hypothetical protein
MRIPYLVSFGEGGQGQLLRGQPVRRRLQVDGGLTARPGDAVPLLELEMRQRNRRREDMSETAPIRQVRIAGQPFALRARDVARALRGVDPEPITSHYVVVGTRRFPPKQAISAVTGLDRADFTTHQARRTLMRLGFSAGRRSHTNAKSPSSGAAPAELAERLRSLRGQWVAVKDEEVIHAANSPQELVGWLGRQGQSADSVFRVPDDELAATGLAPL